MSGMSMQPAHINRNDAMVTSPTEYDAQKSVGTEAAYTATPIRINRAEKKEEKL